MQQISTLSLGLASIPALSAPSFPSLPLDASPQQAAKDEDFWFQIRQAFDYSPNLINLNNGGVSPSPRVVQEAQRHYQHMANEAPGYYMWRQLRPLREAVRRELARLAGVESSELALFPNATQALETVILGLDLQPGEHVLTTDQDYPSMLHTLDLRNRRNGIVVDQIKIPVPAEDPEVVVQRFEEALTPQTKLILVCHMVNLSGQILPIREISEMAKRHGALVLVDGAHSFGQLDFNVPDLGCDFFATSLHKWLNGPFGTGMLYIKEELIPSIWPINGYPPEEQNQISKFEHQGTLAIPAEVALGTAIDFHDGIGIARKEARLRYLKDYWTQQVVDLPGIHLATSMKEEFSCAMATVSVADHSPLELLSRLQREFQIYSTPIQHEDIQGVRISPSIYTSLGDLDHLVRALTKIAASK